MVECGGKGNVKAIREGIEYAFGRPGSGWVCLAEALAFSGCAGNEDVAGRRRFVVESIELFERRRLCRGM